MSETKFTPGPWRWCSGGYWLESESADVVSVECHVCDGSSGEHECGAVPVISDYNKSLIAAAPELYAAVESLISAITPLHNAHFQIERECISDSDVEDAQAAVRDAELVLAKARGENQ